MTFNTLNYLLFLPAVYLANYLTSDRWRWLLLLTASYGFYASFKAPYLLAVLLIVTGISYFCGQRIATHRNESIRKRWLWAGIFACIIVLVLFKYLPFLESQTNSIFGANSTISSIIVSIGVSFFSFQAISYLVDIYLEIEEPECHFGHFALYMAFFPKLQHGPIERASDLLTQLKQPYVFDYEATRSGMLLFAWGLFKKVAIADKLADFVSNVYSNVGTYSPISILVSTYLYSFQIYLDFSGYTDMALGSALLFNIRLTQNFRNPYLATSIADFWRRWHISLSRWLQDYLFRPLQMKFRNFGNAGTMAALILTFLICGIWHGASWTFVVWGLLHGLFMSISVATAPLRKKLHRMTGLEGSRLLHAWQVFVTFNLVSFAWIFFRAESLNDAMFIVHSLINNLVGETIATMQNFDKITRVSGLPTNRLKEVMALLTVLAIVHIVRRFSNINSTFFERKNTLLRWMIYVALALSVIHLGVIDEIPFVYNQF